MMLTRAVQPLLHRTANLFLYFNIIFIIKIYLFNSKVFSMGQQHFWCKKSLWKGLRHLVHFACSQYFSEFRFKPDRNPLHIEDTLK